MVQYARGYPIFCGDPSGYVHWQLSRERARVRSWEPGRAEINKVGRGVPLAHLHSKQTSRETDETRRDQSTLTGPFKMTCLPYRHLEYSSAAVFALSLACGFHLKPEETGPKKATYCTVYQPAIYNAGCVTGRV